MPIGARILILAHFFLIPQTLAQTSSTADDMGGIDLTGLVVFSRQIENHYPVTGDAHLFVSNQFGAIRVSTWDNPVINMKAIIRVGAENEMKAERYAQSISIDASQVDNRVQLRTVYPNVQDAATIGYTVELQVTVPATVSLTTENLFGDTLIANLAGEVIVDSSYGAVELSSLGGRAQVRAKGDFPLSVNGLPKGGTFFLRSTRSKFSDLGGPITINNYLGSVSLNQLHDTAEVMATSDNGPIRLLLAPTAKPHLRAAIEFGEIESEISVQRQSWGKKEIATLGDTNAMPRIELEASFGSILIQGQALEPLAQTPQTGDSEPVQEVIKATIPFAEGRSLLVDAIDGDLTLEATDQVGEIQLEVTRFVRVGDVANARAAMDGLAWRTDESGSETRIWTTLESDIEALSITEYKLDLHIKYPKTTSLNVVHPTGSTQVLGSAGNVGIEKKSGNVLVSETTGPVEIISGEGDVDIRNSSGAIAVSASDGTIRTRNSKGALRLESRRGRIVMDAPRSTVYARNENGDIRIVALDGVFGDFDVVASNGNINMVIPPESAVHLLLNAVHGSVYSSFPVTGTLEKHTESFQGRLNAATHRVLLETQEGNIVLD